MSREHVLERTAWVLASIDETFGLFSDAFRLASITPPWLHFRVITPGPIEIEQGTLIDYRLRLHRVPIRWRTEIETWDPPNGFVDVQLRGPFRHWHHTHRFESRDGGTSVVDRVRYSLPLGPLGQLAHLVLVRRDLDRIFEFREQQIARLLGAEEPEVR